MSQVRKYIFTVNNYTNVLSHLPEELNYICYGPEIGKQGTPHIQGYCEFHSKTRFKSAKKYIDTLFGNGCWCMAMSKDATTEHNLNYTSGNCAKKGYKINPDWTEFGERMKQGERKDIAAYQAAIDDGMSYEDCYRQFFAILTRYPNSYNLYKSAIIPPRTEPPMVLLFWGLTGTGKSSIPKRLKYTEVVYDGKFFSGSAEYIYIDDLEPKQFNRSLFLRITHEHDTTVPIKGGWAPWRPKVIIFTSNFSPDALFGFDQAYYSRFSHIQEFTIQFERQVAKFVSIEELPHALTGSPISTPQIIQTNPILSENTEVAER